MKLPELVTVAQLSGFTEIIDVRTPAEFADDHIPGAVNYPVLSDEERVRVGTLYKQVSPFEAKKLGAALIAANIAHHLQASLTHHPKEWRPLVYCWRGGQRSGAMQIILRQIGWKASKLEGGYKAWRQSVIAELDTLPLNFEFRVICGATGSGKTRILQAIDQQGGQILDLETLASHKGSVLGVLPDTRQPSQKAFETLLWQNLKALDPAKPVYVEAESRRIGNLYLPTSLLENIRKGKCLEIQASESARIRFLMQDYEYFLQDPEWLMRRLEGLKAHLGKETISHWQNLAETKAWEQLTEALMSRHYDPLYRRSRNTNFEATPSLGIFSTDTLDQNAIEALAGRILQTC